jgi:hypothetical protein
MNNTYTPGPWEVSPYYNITSRNGTIAKTEQMPGNFDSERTANARLIAAAPDLLSALERAEAALSWFINDEGECDIEALDEAKAVIAKARGESL